MCPWCIPDWSTEENNVCVRCISAFANVPVVVCQLKMSVLTQYKLQVSRSGRVASNTQKMKTTGYLRSFYNRHRQTHSLSSTVSALFHVFQWYQGFPVELSKLKTRTKFEIILLSGDLITIRNNTIVMQRNICDCCSWLEAYRSGSRKMAACFLCEKHRPKISAYLQTS